MTQDTADKISTVIWLILGAGALLVLLPSCATSGAFTSAELAGAHVDEVLKRAMPGCYKSCDTEVFSIETTPRGDIRCVCKTRDQIPQRGAHNI